MIEKDTLIITKTFPKLPFTLIGTKMRKGSMSYIIQPLSTFNSCINYLPKMRIHSSQHGILIFCLLFSSSSAGRFGIGKKIEKNLLVTKYYRHRRSHQKSRMSKILVRTTESYRSATGDYRRLHETTEQLPIQNYYRRLQNCYS